MKKLISYIVLIILTISIYTYINKPKDTNIMAYKGIINLNDRNFNKDGTINLNGQWELYNNKLLDPSQLINIKPDKYLFIPGDLKSQINGKITGYMTIRLKVYVSENTVYGLKIQRMLSASKIWVNNILQDETGKVGRTYNDEKGMYLPTYSYFTADNNGVIDIVIQTSNYRDIFPIIRSINFGLKNQIMNKFILDSSIDMIVLGSLLIIEFMFLLLYIKFKNNRYFLYFALLCIIIQLRCLFLNERIIVHLFPDMPFELLSKTAAVTYYIWISIYILFLKEIFKNLPKKIICISLAFSIIFTLICIITNNIFYDRLSILGECILFVIIISVFVFLLKQVSKRQKNAEISLLSFSLMILAAINDILTNNGILYGPYTFQIVMFIFAFLQAYMILAKYSNDIKRLEKLKIQNQIIYDRSIRDSLTGLYNRKYINSILDKAIKEYIELEKIFTVLMLDIDHFKAVNDNYGHPYGDMVIVTVSNILKNTLRDKDYVGRYGGEEFIIIMTDTKKEEAKEIAERIRNYICCFSWKHNKSITVSGGVYENDFFTKEECIEAADKFLYLAKRNGRNKIEV